MIGWDNFRADSCGLDFKRGKKGSANWFDNAVFFDYYTRLKEICLNEFEWVNLPDTCDERFLELILFEFGYALFFEHKINKSLMTLQCAIAGPYNVYRIPIRRRAYAITGFQQNCSDLDSVIIFNNRLRQPTALTIELYAQRLTELEQTISVNLIAQKTPILIKGSLKQEKQLKQVYKQWRGNEPVIFGDSDVNFQDTLQVLNTGAPEIYPNLMLQKQRVWQEAMTFAGINNANTDKRERLTDDEVNANNGEIEVARLSRLQARKDACRLINQLFADRLPKGEIDVRFREGGVKDGEIYNRTRDDATGVDRGDGGSGLPED